MSKLLLRSAEGLQVSPYELHCTLPSGEGTCSRASALGRRARWFFMFLQLQYRTVYCCTHLLTLLPTLLLRDEGAYYRVPTHVVGLSSIGSAREAVDSAREAGGGGRVFRELFGLDGTARRRRAACDAALDGGRQL